MEELDNLQLELELLASSMLVRQTSITHQIAIINQMEKGKVVPRTTVSPGKRFKQDPDQQQQRPTKKIKDNSGKSKDAGHTTPNPLHSTPPPPPPPPPPPKFSKVKCSVVKNEPLFDVPDLPSQETPRPPPPRNDITNRFWALVDTYCQEMTADDIKLLEELLSGHNEDPDIYKVQPLGKHYTLRWAQEDLVDEQKEGSKLNDSGGGGGGGKKKGGGINVNDVPEKLLKEVDQNHPCTGDDAPSLGPVTQRLLAGLVEEKLLLTQNTTDTENKGSGAGLGGVAGVGAGRPGFLRSLGLGSGAGLEKRLRRELQEHGILDADHLTQDDDDEILRELKRCQAELRAVAAHNHTQLARLLRLARDALYRHDLKKKLRDAEAKVLEAWKCVQGLRGKRRPLGRKEREAAWRAVREREAITRQLDSLSPDTS